MTIFTLVFIGIIVFVILVFIYNALGLGHTDETHVKLIPSLITISPEWEDKINYSNLNVKTPYTSGLSLMFDLYLYNSPENDNWNSRPDEEKPIFNSGHAPLIAYHPMENYLSMDFLIQNNQYNQAYQKVIIKDVPLQQWIKVLFIIQGRDLEVYFNDKLIKKTQLDGFPIYQKSDVYLGKKNHNIIGKLGNMYLKLF